MYSGSGSSLVNVFFVSFLCLVNLSMPGHLIFRESFLSDVVTWRTEQLRRNGKDMRKKRLKPSRMPTKLVSPADTFPPLPASLVIIKRPKDQQEPTRDTRRGDVVKLERFFFFFFFHLGRVGEPLKMTSWAILVFQAVLPQRCVQLTGFYRSYISLFLAVFYFFIIWLWEQQQQRRRKWARVVGR